MSEEVVRIRIEYEDGSALEATGDDARAWGEWIDEGVGLAVAHGSSAPDIDYDEAPDWRGDADTSDK